MAQVPIARCFCAQCGTAITKDAGTCPHCATLVDARYSQPQQLTNLVETDTTLRLAFQPVPDLHVERMDDLVDTEATLKVASRPMPGLHTDKQRNVTEDTNATIRVTRGFSSRLYAQAIEQDVPPVPVIAVPVLPERHSDTPSSQDRLSNIPLKRTKQRTRKKTLVQVGCGIGLVALLTLLVLGVAGIGYENDPRATQQVVQSRAELDRLIAQAGTMGVPPSLLQPVLQQEQQLTNSNRSFPLHFFNANTDQRLAQSYRALSGRIPQIIALATAQAQARAQQDIRNFQTALIRETVRGPGNNANLSQQYSQDEAALALAKTPADYAIISRDAREGILALAARQIALSQLADFNATIARLKTARLDVTAMEMEYQNDLQVFTGATRERDFQNVSTLIDAQYQQIVVGSVQAFPYVSATRLNEMQTQIGQLKTYGIDIHSFQERLNADQVMMEQAKTVFDDLLFLKQIDADIAAMHDELVQGEARYLVQQFRQEVAAWAKAHPYYDRYDGRTYALNSGYMQAGIGATLDRDLASAETSVDFEVMVDEAQNALFNLRMFESDYNDATPYNQAHKTDLAMLNHYKLQDKMVLMVSLVEQVMRVYQNGKLLRSFYITTGRAERPSLPGVWGMLDRKSPIIFKSGDPKGSPYWFPDTPIKYAMLYHWGGFFVHDAPWRATFGPGTQFPHQDAGGNTSYNFDGSHGCINLSENDAAWVYQHTDWNTLTVIY